MAADATAAATIAAPLRTTLRLSTNVTASSTITANLIIPLIEIAIPQISYAVIPQIGITTRQRDRISFTAAHLSRYGVQAIESPLLTIDHTYTARITISVIEQIVEGSHLDITVTITGADADPDTATFLIRHASEATPTTYTYDGGVTPYVTKPVAGTYQISVPVEQSGTWYWDFDLVWDDPAYAKVITGRVNVARALASGA